LSELFTKWPNLQESCQTKVYASIKQLYINYMLMKIFQTPVTFALDDQDAVRKCFSESNKFGCCRGRLKMLIFGHFWLGLQGSLILLPTNCIDTHFLANYFSYTRNNYITTNENGSIL
jgi:hypothetical protein